MKKKTLFNALSYLSKIAETEAQIDSIAILRTLTESIEEEANDSKSDGFPLPNEAVSDNAFTVYSDGACRGNPGPGAWASMGQDLTGKVIFEKSGVDVNSTNNRMELDGAYYALEALFQHFDEEGIEDQQLVYLYSDSKYVVDGILKWAPGWKRRGWKKADGKQPENVDRWKRLESIVQGRNVMFYWVRGHAGHPQNERCDLLANQALDESGF